MNTDQIDLERYARWWEQARDDRTVCPCGVGAEPIVSGRVVLKPGDGTCPRHRLLKREVLATGIIEGTFFEDDLTPEEAARADAVAHGNSEGVSHDNRPLVPAAFRESLDD